MMSKDKNYYKSILQNSTVVIKISGKIIQNPKHLNNVISDIKNLILNIKKIKIVLVFGFGIQLDNYIYNVNKKNPVKHNGRRITSNADIDAIKKISGELLINLLSLFSKSNINCFPIPVSRKDLIIAKKRLVKNNINYGNVGDIIGVNSIYLQNYFNNHDLIIMPSIVLDKENSEILNVNADTVATEIAIALNANKLIFISDVEYIIDQKGNRISSVNENEINQLIKNKIIKNGMVVKVQNAFDALKRGIEKVHLIGGIKKNCLLDELNTENGVGTVFEKKYVEY